MLTLNVALSIESNIWLMYKDIILWCLKRDINVQAYNSVISIIIM